MLQLIYSKKISLLLALILLSLVAVSVYRAHTVRPKFNPTAIAMQLVVVTTSDWNSAKGVLQRYERTALSEPWSKIGDSTNVAIGKNGLGWGIGLHGEKPITPGPLANDQSSRSPAGVFSLNIAFGKAPKNEWNVKLPYKQVSTTLFCPTDVASKYYNRLVDTKYVAADWKSAINMQEHVNSGAFKYGVVIGNNFATKIPNRGACIFLHSWRQPNQPSTGCTVLEETKVKELVAWLNPQKYPVLVQLPKQVYSSLKHEWNLPVIDEVSEP